MGHRYHPGRPGSRIHSLLRSDLPRGSRSGCLPASSSPSGIRNADRPLHLRGLRGGLLGKLTRMKDNPYHAPKKERVGMIIDLSQVIEDGMPVYPGDLPVIVRQNRFLEEHGFNNSILTPVSYTHLRAHETR